MVKSCPLSSSSIHHLSDDVLGVILSHCSSQDLFSVSLSCHPFRLVSQCTPELKSVYSTFSLSSSTSWNDIKVLIAHAFEIDTLIVHGYSFLEEMYVDFPNVKKIFFFGCTFSSLDFISLTMKKVETVILSNCTVHQEESYHSSWISSLSHISFVSLNHKILFDMEKKKAKENELRSLSSSLMVGTNNLRVSS